MKIKYFIILLLVVSTAFAAKIDVSEVSPQPVSPGNDLTMRVAYTNVGVNTERITANLDISFPFTLKTSDSPSQFDLCALCSRTVTYFLTVDSAAKSGTYPIFVRTGDTSRTVDVSVSGRPNIVLFSDPVTNATPSNKFELAIDVTNIGTGIAKEIRISPVSNDFIALGTSILTVGEIAAGQSKPVVFWIVAKDSIDPGAYNIPFDIKYFDELGTPYNTSQNIGLEVVNRALLSVQSIKITASAGGQPAAGSPTTIIVRLQNIGTGDADSIESEITCDGQSAKAFLGQLQRDEDAPAVFEIILPSGGKRTCTVSTQYSDDLGVHTVSSSFDASVRNADIPFWLIILIILAAGGFYYYRRRKAHKK